VKLFSFWRSLATFRVRIALNLKGIMPDEVIDIDLMKGKQREDAFRKVNPMMALPALIENDGTMLFESLAIIEYLDETHPQPPLLPKEPKARARVRGLAQLIACDTHPLIVPRVREYLAHEYKVDEAGVLKWGHHWHKAALTSVWRARRPERIFINTIWRRSRPCAASSMPACRTMPSPARIRCGSPARRRRPETTRAQPRETAIS